MATTTTGLVAVLSIHPRYAHAILDGSKTVEFRKKRLRDEVTHVIIYSTVPDRGIIGYFEVASQEEEPPTELWNRFGACGVIEKNDFFDYYGGRSIGVGIRVTNPRRLPHKLDLNEALGISTPPQSFQYLPSNVLDGLAAAI